MKAIITDKGTVVALLRDAAQLVDAGDSMEGTITWEEPMPGDGRPPGSYAVRAVYRTGTSLGQGGTVLYGDMEGPQPADPWLALRELVEATQLHLGCQDCGGTGKLIDGTRCVTAEALEEARGAAWKVVEQQRAYLADMQAKGIDTAA